MGSSKRAKLAEVHDVLVLPHDLLMIVGTWTVAGAHVFVVFVLVVLSKQSLERQG